MVRTAIQTIAQQILGYRLDPKADDLQDLSVSHNEQTQKSHLYRWLFCI